MRLYVRHWVRPCVQPWPVEELRMEAAGPSWWRERSGRLTRLPARWTHMRRHANSTAPSVASCMWKKDKLQRTLSVVKAIYFISSAVWLGGLARLSQRWSNVTHQEKEVRRAHSSVLFTRHGETCTPTEPPYTQFLLPLTCSEDFAKKRKNKKKAIYLPPNCPVYLNAIHRGEAKEKKKEAKKQTKSSVGSQVQALQIIHDHGFYWFSLVFLCLITHC